MSEEQTGPSSDLSQDQNEWVAMYRHGLRFRKPQPDYDDVRDDYEDIHGDGPRMEEDIQLRIVETQMDLLLRFTGASDYDIHRDPDSWLETYYALAGKWLGRDAGIDEQLESVDRVLSQTGGPLWRPDLYLPLDEVHQAAVETVPASPQTAPSTSASSWREPPRLIDWTPDEDPAAGYLRDLRANRQQALELGLPERSEDVQPQDSRGRLTELARKFSSRVLRPRSDDTHRDAHPLRQPGSGGGLEF
ncbi:hypothetical protein EAO79_17920 [Plantibacter sp. PA-3-X8]|uniref:hypothetical protein n=1 Tax=Plantibacter TaxID=190323 RepID=UPI000F5D9F18|nr:MULTISPECIES: hypothetical protein [Plantibacter]AZH84564.1 hypothetical protein EAO79_17920 [Plantibacter sp. PA-3-X8]MBD8103873.1 hypothetical protein [Plantibacter sp. CFBP 8775]MBD8467321.1 hypothetical protein [Plantibacter sp. CFBP 8798]TKJ96792.1 hypothetical protein PlfCFBP13513_15335 [Plantibacter flavus]